MIPKRCAPIIVAGLFATITHASVTPERVRFPSLDRVDGHAVEIEGLLLRPNIETSKPAPAVVLLHGCGGLFSSARGRETQLAERHAVQAQKLVDAGYYVLLPDSFGSRGMKEVCTIKSGQRTVDAARRRLDTLGALEWLAGQRGVARDRIALLGWSHGGSTGLATINAGRREVAAANERSAAPSVRAAVLFYPGCSSAARNVQWRTSVPTRILIGDADDWTPAQACVDLASKAKAHGMPLETHVYAGAHHGFDAPSGRVRLREDVPNGVNPGKGVHVGPDPLARDDAHRRVMTFLRSMLE
ncbi:MAG TPA: dienelactone hydrolase family protein [Casimicrobiaceae bacterium]|nr:dienelactone hydrolase family protein [Casimicrobiaceae bacterium]